MDSDPPMRSLNQASVEVPSADPRRYLAGNAEERRCLSGLLGLLGAIRSQASVTGGRCAVQGRAPVGGSRQKNPPEQF